MVIWPLLTFSWASELLLRTVTQTEISGTDPSGTFHSSPEAKLHSPRDTSVKIAQRKEDAFKFPFPGMQIEGILSRKKGSDSHTNSSELCPELCQKGALLRLELEGE